MSRADMMFVASASARYHRRRASFLERTSAAMSTIILLGGAGAFIGLVGEATLFAKIITLLIVLVGVVQIVFQVDRCAAEHRRWLKSWNAILSEISQEIDPTRERLNEWVRQRQEIESDCVSEMRALANDCYNRTMSALDRKGTPFKITGWQRFWMQIFSFENASYE